MFNKIKEIFGYGGVQKVIGTEDVEQEVSEKNLDISQPVYTIVEKVKENPKRLKFSNEVVCSEEYFKVWDYNVKDTITGCTGTYMIVSLSDISDNLTINGLALTRDEKSYILSELKPILKPIYDERKVRYKNIIESRNRAKMQKIWEG